MQRFSQQVVMKKCFLNPEKKLAQSKNRVTPTHSRSEKNDATVPKATLITSKG